MVVAMQVSGLTGRVVVPARPSARFSGRRVAAPTNGCTVFAKKEGNWLPGAVTPKYLDELPAYVSKTAGRLLRFEPLRRVYSKPERVTLRTPGAVHTASIHLALLPRSTSATDSRSLS